MNNKIINNVDKPKAQIIFAHGAGANMCHDFMNEITQLLNKEDINVLRFNFPYMNNREETGRRYPPDRMPKLLECYQSIILELGKDVNNIPLFIGGKSMGGRVAATLMSNNVINKIEFKNIKGVFCLGYPFHPPKKLDKLRLEPLIQAIKPVLILQGERDTLGSKQEIEEYDLPELCNVVYLEDGDHSLKPRVKSGFTHQQHLESAVQSIVSFINKHN